MKRRSRVLVLGHCCGLVRLYIPSEGAEITCTREELRILRVWADAQAGRTREERLPVGEYVDPSWSTAYRFTADADAVYRSVHPLEIEARRTRNARLTHAMGACR